MPNSNKLEGVRIDKLHGVEWSTNDLSEKFSHSYFIASLVDKGITILDKGVVWIDSAYDGNNQCLIRKDEKSELLLLPYSGVLIVEERPLPCISNLGDTGAFMFNYNPARQWRRGFCAYNSYLTWYPWKKPVNGNEGEWMWDVAKAIVKPVHLHLDEALAAFKNDKVIARALSNQYWLVRRKDDIELYRGRAFVGSFLGKKFFSNEIASILSEELRMELPVLTTKYKYAP
jgi:hypothetical protein